MVTEDANRIRVLGVDMRSRVRRRWVVVLVYLAYFWAMNWCKFGHGWLTPGIGMWGVSILMVVNPLFWESGLVKALRGSPEVPLDERELTERSKASQWTLAIVSALLVVNASWPVYASRSEIVKTFLTIAVLAMTLPQAVLLWREAEPCDDELKVVEREA
jgi:hypothetical protein